ncbi:MAG: cation:proton antiporter [Eubacteriales bacterium]|nr:cation:proton antiporter [Eubacteriales bacterium]MDD4389630.1 cation:proton antiporter [Eubacteriales bacterium]
MAGLHGIIIDLALILTAAAIVTIVFKKINQPVVLGYIVAGFLMTPFFDFWPSVLDEESIEIWGGIGIIFLMFALGLEFSFHKIASVGKTAIVTALVVMTAMTLIGYGVGQAMGWSVMDSIFLGGIISMSSTMIILKAFEELGLKKEKFASIVLGTLVIEDIAGIFMMIILTTISVGKEVSGLELIQNLSILILILVVILSVGIYVVPSFLNRVDKQMNDETLLIFSLGFCFLMVVISVSVGFSEALGAFLAGSILAGTKSGHRIEELVAPIKNMFGAIFFISVGMMIVPATLIEYIIPILILTVVTILGQMTFSMMGALISGQPLNLAARVGFSMVQVGEFSFIIASLGMSLGVTSDFLYPIIVCVSVITTFATPIFIKNGGKAYIKISSVMPKKVEQFLKSYTSDKQIENDRDADWSKYLSIYFTKLLVGISILFVITMAGKEYLVPFLNAHIQNKYSSATIAVVIIIFAMVPIINMISTRKNILYSKLWMMNVTNRLPLIALRSIAITTSAIFVLLTLQSIFTKLPLLLDAVVMIGVITISAKSGFVKGRVAGFETRFVSNFNQNILRKAEAERGERNSVWVEDEVYLMQFKLVKIYKRKAVKDFIASRVFHVMFIKIESENGKCINLPMADSRVKENDIITVVGSKQHLEAYALFCEKQDYLEIVDKPIITLKEFLYHQMFDKAGPEERIYGVALPINKKSKFAKQAISNCDFISKYKGVIVGIERNLLPIVSPLKDFIIQEGDILWVLGNEIMVDNLIQDKLMKK